MGLEYVYDAVGAKLKKTVSTGTVTEYAGSFIYQNDRLQFFGQPEGYVSPSFGENGEITGFGYVYQYTDHLGNVRLSYTEDPNNPGEPTIIEENNYYPFGLRHKGYNEGGDTSLGNDVAQKWKYNGKEIDEDLGLNLYQYGFRLYDPTIGRFPSIDPIAEQFPHVSAYNYAENRPIDGIDLWGLQYVNANEARIQLMRDGKILYKMQNMSWLTQSAFRSLNNDPSNWQTSQNNMIGVPVEVGKISFTHGNGNDLLRGKPKEINRTVWKDEYKFNKDGKLNRSRRGRKLGGRGSYGSKSSSASKGLLLFAALDFGARAANSISSYYDNSVTTQHFSILQNKALIDLVNAVKDGKVAPKYINNNDLSVILNVIFQGDAFGDEELEKLGLSIYNWYNIYKPLDDAQKNDNKIPKKSAVEIKLEDIYRNGGQVNRNSFN